MRGIDGNVNLTFLQYALENGIITDEAIAEICGKVDMNKRQHYLKMHRNKIYQAKDGRWFTKVPILENGQITKKRDKAFHSKKEAEDYVIQIYRTIEENPTVAEIFKTVIDEKLEAEEIVPATHLKYQVDFRRFFSEFGKRHISTIQDYDVEDFLIEQKRAKKLTAKGYAALKGCTTAIFRYARRKRFISFDVDDVIKNINWGRKAFKTVEHEEYDDVFTDDEMRKVIDCLVEDLDNIYNLGLLLLFGTGMRIGELASLTWQDFDGQFLYVRKTETTYVDSGKWQCGIKNSPKTFAGRRSVPIPSSMLWIMDRLKIMNPDEEYIFVTYSYKERKKVRCRADYFRKRLRNICIKIGIPSKSPHKIRKTYASILLDYGIKEKTIIENMGHTDISVTKNHYGRQRRSQTQRLQTINGIEEFNIMGCSDGTTVCSDL